MLQIKLHFCCCPFYRTFLMMCRCLRIRIPKMKWRRKYLWIRKKTPYSVNEACGFVLWTLSAIKRWHRKLGTKFVTHNSPIMQFLPIPWTAFPCLYRSIHFGDVSEANGRELTSSLGPRDPKRFGRAENWGLGTRQMHFSCETFRWPIIANFSKEKLSAESSYKIYVTNISLERLPCLLDIFALLSWHISL